MVVEGLCLLEWLVKMVGVFPDDLERVDHGMQKPHEKINHESF